MRNKHIWEWIMCLALLLSTLSGCFLFNNRNGDEAVQTLSPAPNQLTDTENQADISAETPNTELELPEIEIPGTPTDSEKPDSEGTGIQEAAGTPESSVPQVEEHEENTTAQQEPEEEPVLGESDIVIDDNGDILLPEVP